MHMHSLITLIAMGNARIATNIAVTPILLLKYHQQTTAKHRTLFCSSYNFLYALFGDVYMMHEVQLYTRINLLQKSL